MKLRLSSFALIPLLGLAACGGGDDNDPAVDAPINANCEAPTPGTLEIAQADEQVMVWSGPITPSLSAGETAINLEFYSGITASLAGTFDLSTAPEDNYKTCALCIRVIALNAAGDDAERIYFQAGGTLTLTEDPFVTGKMVGNLSNVSLVEVTIAEDFTSTPVAGGSCIAFSTLALNADSIPAGWTCADAAYSDGTNCDCQCGELDPDCDLENAPVVGCTGEQVCVSDVCTDTCDVLSAPPVGCPAGVCGFSTAQQDLCYTDATIVDAAALGATCTSDTALFCAVTNTVAAGICDTLIGGDALCREACDATADCNTGAGETCVAIEQIAPKGVCIAPPTNDTCGTATPLVIGTPVTSRSGGGINNTEMGLEECTGFPQPGPDVMFSVTLTMGTAYTITLDQVSAAFDPSIAVIGAAGLTACNATGMAVTCLGGADAAVGGENETLTFTPTATGVHYIIVDTFNPAPGGSFRINVTGP